MRGFLVMLVICSVTMSALALLYMAVTPLLAKRYSGAGRYYAWLVIVAGLIIPFRPRFGGAIVQVAVPGGPALPALRAGNGAGGIAAAPMEYAVPPVFTDISWWRIGAALWLAGMILFLVYHGIKHLRFLKLAARWSENVTDGPAPALLRDLKTRLGVTQSIGLQVCDCIGSPMMTGFAHPRILLPRADFAADELRFILKHELVHYKRRDLWVKCLVLAAAAIHWFNPVVHLMAKAIDIACEVSCDESVVRGTDADTRRHYSETIIGVVRFRSKRKTALSTHFYGGKKGMKTRIFSIRDMGKKKAGAAVLGAALILTLGTGIALAANAETRDPSGADKGIAAAPWLIADFVPSPQVYAPYAAFGITISNDGKDLLYQGQPVRQFVDEKAESWAFYLDEAGKGNWSVARNAAGEITGIESMTAQKAKEYYERFFAEELDPDFPAKVSEEAARDLAEDVVKENIQEGGNKYEQYRPFGVTYSPADQVLSYNGQRVKFFIDRKDGQGADALWTDAAGTVNLAVIRDASGRITNIETITDQKAKDDQSAFDEYNGNALKGLEERVEARINARYSKN